MKKHLNQLDLIIKYLLGAVMLVVALYPKFPFIKVPGTFVSIRFEDFLILLLAVFWLIAVLNDFKRLLKMRLVKAILLFLGVGLVSYLSAILVTQTVSVHIGLLHLVRRIEYLIPLFAGLYIVEKDRDSIKFYFNIFVIIIFVAFVYGLGQKYFKFPVIITQNQEYAKGIALFWIPGSHINSTFAGHYDLATYLVLTLPIIGVALTTLKGIKTKILLGVVYLMGVWLLAVAVSRISIFSYFVAIGAALFLVRKYKALIIISLISLVVFSLSSSLLVRYGRIFEVLKMSADNSITVMAQENIPLPTKIPEPTPTPVPKTEDRSTSIRLNVEWPRALRALNKNPLLGTGYSSIGLATDNDYLRLLGEIGILGLMAFGLLIFSILELYLKKLPFRTNFKGVELAFVAGTAGALVGILINALFIDVFEASKFAILFWSLIGMTVALLTTKKAKN